MHKDIRSWVKTCIDGQKVKINKHTRFSFGKFQSPDERFQIVNMDIIGPLPVSDGKSYFLTCIDRFTSWAEAYPVSDISAETIASTFYANWVCRFGLP